MTVRAALVAGLALLAASASAAPPVVRASVAPDAATVGDRLTLTLSVARDADAVAVFPNVGESIGPFDVLSSVVAPVAPEGERATERRDYVIAAFRTGSLAVPPLPFLVISASGETLSVLTDSVVVAVASVLPDTAGAAGIEPRDIRPPVSLPREIWPFVVAAAAAVGAYVAYRYLRRRRLRRKAGPARPGREPAVAPEAAHVAAFERLAALERAGLPARGEFARFYDGLSDILRLYLGDRFGVRAIDMTTDEVAPAMERAGIADEDVAWTVRFLSHADLAKFAKLAPTVERANDDFAAAREFVERTRFRGEAAAPPDDEARPAEGEATAC
ncbi:MAG: hypothetical protein FJY74_03475 [Candidatus Eisenbacteria bacterium]|nr:hypothetical protein [Candidatus Eisenbacteria bacterium]